MTGCPGLVKGETLLLSLSSSVRCDHLWLAVIKSRRLTEGVRQGESGRESN